MHTKFIAIVTLVGAALFSSCEEVIEIDLNDASPQLVVEATITEGSVATVILTQTSSYFDASESPKVTDALVSIKDNSGNVEALQHIGDGVYKSNVIIGTTDRIYELSIDFNNELYTATSTLHAPIPISQLEALEALTTFGGGGPGSGGPGGDNEEQEYNVLVRLFDPVEQENFYRVKFYQNGVYRDEIEYYVVNNDDISNGNEMGMTAPRLSFNSGDTVVVELLHIDEPTYNYFDQLIDVLGGGQGQQSDAPYNPDNNISGDALGYFGAWSSVRDTIVID